MTQEIAESKRSGAHGSESSSPGRQTRQRWHISQKAVSSSGCDSGSVDVAMNDETEPMSDESTDESEVEISPSGNPPYCSMAPARQVRQPTTGVEWKAVERWASVCGSSGAKSGPSVVIALEYSSERAWTTAASARKAAAACMRSGQQPSRTGSAGCASGLKWSQNRMADATSSSCAAADADASGG